MDYHKILTENIGNAVQVFDRAKEDIGFKGYGDMKEFSVKENGSFSLLLVHEHHKWITNFDPNLDTIRIYDQPHEKRMIEFHLELAEMGIQSHDEQRLR